jgi:hypothetical protein
MVRGNHKVLIGTLIGVAVAITLFLTLAYGWSWWYLLLSVVLIAAALVLGSNLPVAREQAPPARPLEVPVIQEAPKLPAQEAISDVDLPTNTPNYRMLFSGSVLWEPKSDPVAHKDPGALAKQAIVERAAVVVRKVSPADAAIATHQLAAALGVAEPDSTSTVSAWATGVRLTVRDDDANQLLELKNLGKKNEIWERERDYERSFREYLGDDVLISRWQALIWWMARNVDNIEGAATLIPQLSRLSAFSQDREVPHHETSGVEDVHETPPDTADRAEPHPDHNEPPGVEDGEPRARNS